MEPEELASFLYNAYSDATNHRNFKGDPLPMWAEFRADPNKKVQSDAWVAVASKAIEMLVPEN